MDLHVLGTLSYAHDIDVHTHTHTHTPHTIHSLHAMKCKHQKVGVAATGPVQWLYLRKNFPIAP